MATLGASTPCTPPAWAIAIYRETTTRLDAGQGEAAEAAFRALLARRDEAPPWPEILALTGLSTVWARRGRSFEALVLLRRVSEALLDLGERVRAAGVLGNLCTLLAHLDADVELEPTLERLQALLATLPPEAAPVARDALDLVRCERARRAGRGADAEIHLASFRARPAGHQDPVLKARTALSLAASVAALRGDIDAADRLLAEAASTGELAPNDRLLLLHYRLDVAQASGDPERWRRDARAALDALAPGDADDGCAGWRIAIGVQVAAALEQAGGAPDEVRAAHDLVATALLERMAEIDAAVRFLPTLGLPDLDADAELSAFRGAFARELATSLQGLARWFDEAPERIPAGLLGRLLPDGWAHICAWCQRVSTGDGAWLPVGQFLRRARSLKATHGICPGCRAQAFPLE